eukprot:7376787-Prymnesium_polylepis.4
MASDMSCPEPRGPSPPFVVEPKEALGCAAAAADVLRCAEKRLPSVCRGSSWSTVSRSTSQAVKGTMRSSSTVMLLGSVSLADQAHRPPAATRTHTAKLVRASTESATSSCSIRRAGS